MVSRQRIDVEEDLSERRRAMARVIHDLPRDRDTSNGRKFDLMVDVCWIQACLKARQCLACGWEMPKPGPLSWPNYNPGLRALTDHIANAERIRHRQI